MELTPEILRGAYAYLAETPPFRDWNLPDAEDVTFLVTSTRRKQGHCQPDTPSPQIMLSKRFHLHTTSLMATMAHEMIHLHQYRVKLHRTWHGRAFWAFAAEVCDAHGFDPGQF